MQNKIIKQIVSFRSRCFTHKEIAHLTGYCTRTIARVLKAYDAEEQKLLASYREFLMRQDARRSSRNHHPQSNPQLNWFDFLPSCKFRAIIAYDWSRGSVHSALAWDNIMDTIQRDCAGALRDCPGKIYEFSPPFKKSFFCHFFIIF